MLRIDIMTLSITTPSVRARVKKTTLILTKKQIYYEDIVETAVNHGSFKTLVAAVKHDLVGTLTSERTFLTVFAH
jgi:uncharacterized surface protein with fasciclin (FAS1) repeats